MKPKEFIIKLRDLIVSQKVNTMIGEYRFEGINKTENFGSPGGSWDTLQFPAYQFSNKEQKFLLRLPAQDNSTYIVVEAFHSHMQLINYKINNSNFRFNNGTVRVIENYKMTVNHPRKKQEVKEALQHVGMTDELIFSTKIENINLNQIINDIFTWAAKREAAKIIIRGKTKEDSKPPIISEVHLGTSNIPLNQILYGPPGTGKTFSTINKALEIIDPEFYKQNIDDRLALKKRFDDLMIKDWDSGDNGRIAFTTFHQSMSYEDFVEGIKPMMFDLDEETAEESDALSYKIEKGIFSKICNRARTTVPEGVTFDEMWRKFSEQLFRTKSEVIFKSTSSELKLEKALSSPDSLKLRFKKSWDPSKEQGQAVFHVGKSTIQKLYNQKINLADPDLRQWVTIRDIVGGGRATTHLAVYRSFFEHANLADKFNETHEEKPHVLIIDEINRGNIPQIFGELITLIEENKRSGNQESLNVVLPYSKSRFSVPKNLYLIGTMNTADRSIEALDTALRRRFTFVEMLPDPKIISLHGKSKGDIENIDLVQLLSTINHRIEKLLDKDHQIGHAYFLDITSLDELRLAFKNKIIPLLEEYFYGDIGKIGLILGDNFVKEKNTQRIGFASFKGFDQEIINDLSERKVYQIMDCTSLDSAAFQSIYQSDKD